MAARKMPPAHPGEILLEDFMKPLGITQIQLARDLNLPRRQVSRIVNGKRGITADTALRLARYFGTSPQLLMGLQADYELDVAQDEKADTIAREVHARAAAASVR